MTNEEKAVIQAARALVVSNPFNIMTSDRTAGALVDALNAMDSTPAPMRHFRLAYLVQTIYGSGNGSGNVSCRGPVDKGVLDAWEKGIADLPTNRERNARIVIQTWTELEA